MILMMDLNVLFLLLLSLHLVCSRTFTPADIRHYRETVRRMFQHGYDGYIHHAYPFDELRPLTCDGVNTWGQYSLSLIDALDTLVIMGNNTEFVRVVRLICDMKFDADVNVSVFETNIRILGGLLSAHLLSGRVVAAGDTDLTLEPGWPCSGPLLRLAEQVANKLLPAFQTNTGMPYGTVNLRHGVPVNETTVTCTAGVSSYILEFGTLSRLTGDERYEKVALRSLYSLWDLRSGVNLVGNHIDIQTGKWVALDSGIGAGVDSYFEYLVKGSILLQNTHLRSMFNTYKKSIDKHLKRDDWYFWAGMEKGSITMPIFQSLEAFWPGMLSLIGDIDQAMKSLFNYHQIWQQFGFVPEFYNVAQGNAQSGREGYPLRPELIESIMYLYQATRDPLLLEMGADIVESLEHSAKTSCGYATIKNVQAHILENRMESFFLAETTKYLYLLFDTDNFIHNPNKTGRLINTTSGSCVIDTGGYIFNTEAHPFDSSAIYCCSAQRDLDERTILDWEDNLDLTGLLGLSGLSAGSDYLADIEWPEGLYESEEWNEGYQSETVRLKTLPDIQTKAYTPESSSSSSGGEEVGQGGEEVGQGGEEVGRDGEEVGQGGEEVGQGGEEMGQDVEEVGQGGEELKEGEEEMKKGGGEVGEGVGEMGKGAGRKMRVRKERKVLRGIIPEIRLREGVDLNEGEGKNYMVLSCPAQSFISRLSVLGEMFEVDSNPH